LNEIIKKNVFQLGENQGIVFKKIKRTFIDAPILIYYSRPIVISNFSKSFKIKYYAQKIEDKKNVTLRITLYC